MKARLDEADPVGHVRVGQIVGPFGIKGGVKVVPLTDFPERFDKGGTLYVTGQPRRILDVYWHKTQARVTLEGVTTIEQAEALKWMYVTIPETQRPELEEDEYMASDLVGLKVIEGSVVIGVVDEVIHGPAQDLIRLGETLIPCVKHFVKSVDLDNQTITVELMEGMRPGDSAEEVR